MDSKLFWYLIIIWKRPFTSQSEILFYRRVILFINILINIDQSPIVVSVKIHNNIKAIVLWNNRSTKYIIE